MLPHKSALGHKIYWDGTDHTILKEHERVPVPDFVVNVRMTLLVLIIY